MKKEIKQGFTLIEMLIVIGIIAILMGVLLASFSGSVEKARMVKCATNIHNLGAATINYALGYHDLMPCAQHIPVLSSDVNTHKSGFKMASAWISNLDQGVSYPISSPTPAPTCSFAADREEDRLHALTNGAIWHAVGGNRTTYVCPAFAEACKLKNVLHPAFSYQLNAYFGYMTKSGYFKAGTPFTHLTLVNRPERTLMYAEIPGYANARGSSSGQGAGSAGGNGVAPLPPENLTGGNGTPECDGCLRSRSYGGDESIGFNHRRGKEIVGHVVFCDGHVEAVAAPKNGQYLELTDWLCSGADITMDSSGNYKSVYDQIEEDRKGAQQD